jgi:cytidylate kinase
VNEKYISEVIAIDGPAASGKSSVAKSLADFFSISYINTGNMYRAVTFAALTKGIFIDNTEIDEKKLEKLLNDMDINYEKNSEGLLVLTLNGKNIEKEIRSPAVAAKVTLVAAIPFVRKWLVDKQREFASDRMIVMEGRDIGTVVFPQAKYKFYLTASPEVRALRRLEQKGEVYDGATLDSVAASIKLRDEQDMNRKVSPLRMADDAILIDSSNKTLLEVLDLIIDEINRKRN